jgi:uncharacterized protein YjiS (DUF1127 family)
MTMPSTTTNAPTSSAVRRNAIILLARLRRVVNTWVAEALAYRERQASLCALRQYDDRELRDVGLYRCQIEQVIGNASHRRMRRRRWR